MVGMRTAIALGGLTMLAMACMVDFDKYEPLTSGAGAAAGATSTTGGAGGSGGTSSGGAGGIGGNAGGGGGGGSPTPCGTISLLNDDFDGTDTSAWGITQGSGASATQMGGERVVSLPSQTASWSGFSSRYLYDMRGQRTFIEVPTMVNTNTTAVAFFTLVYDSDNWLNIAQQSGQLELITNIAGQWTAIATVAYDPQQHRWWQFREDAGTMYWETSGDGQTFVERASMPVSMLFAIDLLQVEHGAYTEGGEMSPGAAHFDNLNGGAAATGVWCPASNLTDDFDDGSRGHIWFNSYDGGGCTNDESGGKLSIAQNGTVNDCGYISGARYDVTGDGFHVEVPSVATAINEHYTFMRLDKDSANGAEIVYYGGELTARTEVNGTTQAFGSATYSPTGHRWWRISEAGGTLFFEVSPDGTTWSELAQAPNPFNEPGFTAAFGAGNSVQENNSGTTEFDNFNLPP